MSYWILILAVLGLINAGYIYYKKNNNERLMCITGDGSCDYVVTSKYSQMFGIDNELFGISYYIFVLIVSSITSNGFILPGFIWHNLLIISSLLASLVSIYLTCIQLFVLKEKCDYCVISTIINIAILLAAVYA